MLRPRRHHDRIAGRRPVISGLRQELYSVRVRTRIPSRPLATRVPSKRLHRPMNSATSGSPGAHTVPWRACSARPSGSSLRSGEEQRLLLVVGHEDRRCLEPSMTKYLASASAAARRLDRGSSRSGTTGRIARARASADPLLTARKLAGRTVAKSNSSSTMASISRTRASRCARELQIAQAEKADILGDREVRE